MILVTGGAGFIGSNFILHELKCSESKLINLDKLTYSGNLANLDSIKNDPRYHFIQGDICDRTLLRKIFYDFQPTAVVHFAAESHVDRSIHDPTPFIQTNIVGTFHLLEEAYQYWKDLSKELKDSFRFIHISTDEVFGSLSFDAPPFTEQSQYAPNSPYSASKASSDHLVRSYYHTYHLPTIITNCSNNFGPHQYPEKLIPLIIFNALQGKSLPIYGHGTNIRNWLYVVDHCKALHLVLKNGKPGEYYNIGSDTEMTNLQLVDEICKILDDLLPDSPYAPHASLITFVPDRPGHDLRYAMNSSKLRNDFGWHPENTFNENLRNTIEWYLNNLLWIENLKKSNLNDWITTNYFERRQS